MMSPENFVHWLSGLLVDGDLKTLSATQVKIVKAKLASVFSHPEQAPPAPSTPMIPGAPRGTRTPPPFDPKSAADLGKKMQKLLEEQRRAAETQIPGGWHPRVVC